MRLTAISPNAISSRQDAGHKIVRANPVRFESADAHARRDPPPIHLTPRQLEVLALLCEGLPNKLICRELNISAGTVKVHISCILRELGVSSRLQAVVSARRCGLDIVSTSSETEPADYSAAAAQAGHTAAVIRSSTSRRLEAAA